MSDLKERVSYLRGLIEGLEISDSTKEGRAIKVIAEVLREMATAIEELSETQEEMQDYIDSIDDDLSDIEQEVYGEDIIEIKCPKCGEAIEVEASRLEDPEALLVCPECKGSFSADEVGWEEDEEENEEEEEGR